MKKRGFTIVETTLVIAIAGLIFLLAFVALPALTRSQRDSQRKDDVMKLADSIKKWQSNNNRGALPDGLNQLTGVVDKFIGGNFEDPDGGKYVLVYQKCGEKNCDSANTEISNAKQTEYKMFFVPGAKCNSNNLAEKTANNRKAVVIYKLESGNAAYCFEL